MRSNLCARPHGLSLMAALLAIATAPAAESRTTGTIGWAAENYNPKPLAGDVVIR